MSTSTPVPAWTTGSTLETSYALARDNFLAFFGATLLLTAPSIVVGAIDLGWMIGLAINLICAVLIQITLAWGALQAMTGRKPDLLSMLRRLSRPTARHLLMLGVVQDAVMTVAAVLVVPACFLLAVWAVATPVMLIERTDIPGAFRRSAELTRERRWRVFGVFVLWFLIFGLGLGIVFFLLTKLFGGGDQSPAHHIAGWLFSGLTATVLYTVPAVLYVLLRNEKEGTTIEQLAINRD